MKLRDLLEKIDDPKLAYHDELNPKIWTETDGSYVLKDKVKVKLIKIAEEFVDALGLHQSQVKDYVFTGSNANFNWTALSDVDIHLIIDMKAECKDCKSINVQDCFDAKKSLWNDRHDIKIFGFPVELYAADITEELIGDAGVYSLLRDKWLKQPERKNIKMDSKLIKAKSNDLSKQIDDLIDSKTDDKSAIKDLTGRIANYRKSGLAKGGEFSIENLVFKALRNNGYIDKIRKYAIKAEDHTLSLEEDLKIFELFNSAGNIKVVEESQHVFATEMDLGDRKISFVADESVTFEDKTWWNVVFAEVDASGKSYFHLTKNGHEFEIFSMVKQSMEMLIKKYKPDVIIFTAGKEDKSRASLYQRMLKKFLKGYSIESYDKNKYQIQFKLERL
jgi:hypothetical protein